MLLLHFKAFHTICMHQFGWLSERGGKFLNLLQKEGVPRKWGFPQKKGVGWASGVPTLEETDNFSYYITEDRDFLIANYQKKMKSYPPDNLVKTI